MDKYLKEKFDVPAKHSPEELLQRWRSAVWVKNPRRRFRMVANLIKRKEAEAKKQKIQEKLRVALYVQKAALQFIEAGSGAHSEKSVADDLASVIREHDMRKLKHYGGVDGVSQKLSTSLKHGIESSSVSDRQESYGLNKYIEKPPRSFWLYAWDAMHDVTLFILTICALVSVGVGVATEGWPDGMYDGVGILISVCVVVLVTAISDYKQSLQFRELDKEKKKIYVDAVRDGYRQKISIYDIVAGDVVHLNIGNQIPADGLFVSGYSLLIDESSLSGESEPVNVDCERPFLLSGTKVQDGSATMLVTSVGMRTEWGKLMETLSEGGGDETPLQVKLNGVATIIGYIGAAFAGATFVILMARLLAVKMAEGEISRWSSSDGLKVLNYFAIAVTIVVVAVPEGLPLAVTLSLAFAMKKLMDSKALVRHLSACETMGSATCICTDKTGTLTTNHMVVTKLWISDHIHQIDNGSADNILSSIPQQLSEVLLQAIFHNTSAEVVETKEGTRTILGSPTESAILEFGMLLGTKPSEEDALHIVKIEPFNSARKKMSVVVELPGGGYRAFCKGASEIILQICDKIDGPEGQYQLSQMQSQNVMDVINEFAGEALRTLGLAYKDLDRFNLGDDIPSDGYSFIGVVGIKDPVRPGVREAVQQCMTAGITVRMVTGDNIHTAIAIAKECGILTEDGIAIEGPDFRQKTNEQMREIVPKIQVMARSSPTDKHTLVTQLRNVHKEVVAVTGDGTNDAPALHESDIGLAMGIAGTEVAKENADIIILDDNFSTIVNVGKWGRSVYINIQKFVQFQLTVNVVALMVNFVSACVTGSAPLTAVQLLWVNMIMDTLGALALATEPPTDELMLRPPVSRDESFISMIMWRNIIGQSIYQLAVLGVLEFRGKKLLGLTGSDADDILNTFIFNTFVFCQVFNEINSRDMEKINVFRGIFNSWVFLQVMVITVVFQVIMVEFLGNFASTVPLSWQFWGLSVVIGFGCMIWGVFIKLIPVKVHHKQEHHQEDKSLHDVSHEPEEV